MNRGTSAPRGTPVTGSVLGSLFAQRHDAAVLVRRLLGEHALVHWRLYSVAFALMAIAAGCTAASAYLLGNVINEAYVDRNFPGIVALAAVIVVLAVVMVLKDPVLSLVSLVVVPPALLVLRKLVRRIQAIAMSQFSGGA